MDPDGAVTWLQHMDKENKGGIMRPDFVASEHDFWYKGKGMKRNSVA